MFYSFYTTPTNVIKSQYPCSLPLQSFFSPLPSKCAPHAAPGSLSAFPVLRSHLGPSHRPLSRFLGKRWKHFERNRKFSKSKQCFWLGLSICQECVLLPVPALRQAGGPTHRPRRGDKGREAELARSTAQPGDETAELLQHTGAGMLARAGQHSTLLGKSRKIPFKWQE